MGRGYSLVDGIREKMLKGFRVLFRHFLYYQWVSFRSTPNAPNLQNWVHFWKFGQKKSTPFVPHWVFFATISYSDGSQNHTFRGIEIDGRIPKF